MKGWLKGGLIGFGISVIWYVIMIALNPDSFPLSSLNNIWMILSALFPIIFITALGAMIGSWIDFEKKKARGDIKKNSARIRVAESLLDLLNIYGKKK